MVVVVVVVVVVDVIGVVKRCGWVGMLWGWTQPPSWERRGAAGGGDGAMDDDSKGAGTLPVSQAKRGGTTGLPCC